MVKRAVATVLLLFGMISFVAAAGRPVGMEAALPPDATVTLVEEADLTGDGRSELIVGYTVPRQGRPSTLGQVAVLERMRNGDYRRFDLAAAWPGHYPPQFTVIDVTGDRRPELVIRAAAGGAVGWLGVYRRGDGRYERLLHTVGLENLLWDADADGTPDIIGRQRTGSQADQALQRFRWLGGRFVSWHAPRWSYAPYSGQEGIVPNVLGLTVREAEQRLAQAGLDLGLIAEIDTPGPTDRIFRQSMPAGMRRTEPDQQVHVAVAAGDTRFDPGAGLPGVDRVLYQGEAEPVSASGSAAEWHTWLLPLVSGVEQAVHARTITSPAYLVRLAEPWQVRIGREPVTVRWVGVGLEPPSQGLLFLAPEDPRPGYLWPPFEVALYTRAASPGPGPGGDGPEG